MAIILRKELITLTFIVVDNKKCRFKDVIFTTIRCTTKKDKTQTMDFKLYIMNLVSAIPTHTKKTFVCVSRLSYETDTY